MVQARESTPELRNHEDWWSFHPLLEQTVMVGTTAVFPTGLIQILSVLTRQTRFAAMRIMILFRRAGSLPLSSFPQARGSRGLRQSLAQESDPLPPMCSASERFSEYRSVGSAGSLASLGPPSDMNPWRQVTNGSSLTTSSGWRAATIRT